MLRHVTIACLLLGFATLGFGENGEFKQRVTNYLEGLGAAEPLERLAAEGELSDLIERSPHDAKQVLELLPETDNRMPAIVREALRRVRLRAEGKIATSAVGPSRVSIDLFQAPLSEVLEQFERQTGNRFRDNRAAFGGEADDPAVTLQVKDEFFWPALDELLDVARLSIYPYGSNEELTIVPREPNAARRVGSATYAGPFRFEPLEVSATRGIREPDASRIDVTVEVAWEPRLRPVAISQAIAELKVSADGGQPLAARTPDQSIDLEVTAGEQALQMVISLALPDRGVQRIDELGGRLSGIIPARPHEFRVENIGEAKLPKTLQFGDTTVRVDRFTQSGAIWELHMRLRMEKVGDALASHRGWLFENESYLIKPDGERIANAGFETTMQTDKELGLAYLFDLSGANPFGFDLEEPADSDSEVEEVDPKTLTWVYETATGVYTVPVEWNVGPLEVP